MSRSIRRKNAWNAHSYVDDWIDNYEECKGFFQGQSNYSGHGVGKYHGCTKQQVYDKLYAKFHGETPRNWSNKKRMKEYSIWKLRCRNKMELREAIKNCNEEDIVFTTRRTIRGLYRWFD